MRSFVELLNFMAWVVVSVVVGAWIYLYWEDHQNVMEYMERKPDTPAFIDDGYLRVALIGEKKLDCERVPWSEYGHAIIDGFDTETSFRWVDDLTPLSSFEKGTIDIGIAEFGHKDIANAEFVGFSIAHICHGIKKRSPVYWFGVKQ